MQHTELLVGVSGGIAAYKAADLVSKLVQNGSQVTVILSRAARKFIGATTFEALTGRAVYVDLFSPRDSFRGAHITLVQRANLFCIAPATADIMAKLALGLADDLISTAALACTAPILLAPAMNCEMWAKPAVQRNLDQLRQDGFHIVDPDEGWLSCGQIGAGRMASPEKILLAIQNIVRGPVPNASATEVSRD
jgi:phosphopantothenoylcysteine decarboxylase/phosphopantothenate--cysteine ligase